MITNSSQADIKAVITAEDNASKTLASFGGNVADIAKKAAVAIAAVGAAVTAFGISSVKAFEDSQDRIAQTNAVLKSTGQVAGVTADQVTKLATALQKTTKFSDEDVRSVENLLLTFTSIGKDIFPQATKTVLDMSTALGEDTKSASIQLGKALQDPINGITALRRVGVNFSDDQKKVIQDLVDTGHTAEAQRKILAELNKEFGGSAEAAAGTFSGAMARLKNSINDVQESFGKVIVERLTPFTTKALEAVAAVDWTKVINRTVSAIKDFYGELQHLYNNIKQVVEQVAEYLEPKFIALWHTIEEKVFPTLQKLWKEVIEPLVPVIGTILVAAIGFAIDALNIFLQVVTPVINFLIDHKDYVIAFAAAFGTLAAAMSFGAIVATFQADMAAVMAIMDAVRLNSLAQLNTALVTFGGFGIFAAAAVGALAIVYQKGQETLNLLQSLNDQKAKENAGDIQAMQNVIDNYKAGKITKEQYQHFFQTLAPGAGARAGGGAVSAGQPYIVGEAGEELFIPNTSGRIVDSGQTKQLSGGGTTQISISVNAGAFMGSQVDARKYAQAIFQALKDVAASKNTSLSEMLA
jgi:hypothetical protein